MKFMEIEAMGMRGSSMVEKVYEDNDKARFNKKFHIHPKLWVQIFSKH
jgi:hypothetical protein